MGALLGLWAEGGGTMGGAVFVDMNRNGTRDAADNGIAYVTMLTGTSTAGLQRGRHHFDRA